MAEQMKKLSVCIPVEPGMQVPDYLLSQLLARADASIEIVVDVMPGASLGDLSRIASADPRLVLLDPAENNLSVAQSWQRLMAKANGEWVTLVNPLDMIEPDLPGMLEFAEAEVPGIDALGWNPFQIAADADPDLPTLVAIPIAHHVSEMDKATLLQAFFQWRDARRVPMMPFGLFHGAIRRSLAMSIIESAGPLSWLTLSPQYEWSARVLIFANRMALSNRPLSAVDVRPFQTRDVPSALQGFPFDARLGITAVIAEIQARVLMELGGEWSGFGEDFVRSCVYDCVMEHDVIRHEFKSKSYREAIMRMPGGTGLIRNFNPQYMPHLPAERKRGLSGSVLLVDRFIAGAKTAQQFYAIANDMMTPVTVIADARSKEIEQAPMRSQSFSIATRAGGGRR